MIELVLLPGLDGTGDLFAPFIAHAPAGWRTRVVRYPRDVRLGYRAYTDVARASLPEGGDYLLLGESFSGPVALWLAAEHPLALRGLILCNTFARRPWWSGLGLLPWKSVMARPLPRCVVHRLLGPDGADPELEQTLRAALAAVRPDVLARRFREVLTVDATDALESIAAPILYLRGTGDVLVRAWSSTYIRARRPDVRLARISAPHLLLQTRPVEAWEAITRFAAERAR